MVMVSGVAGAPALMAASAVRCAAYLLEEKGHRMDQDADAGTRECGPVDQRGASALDGVVDQRDRWQRGGDRHELVFGLDGFDEDDVGARGGERPAAFDRLVESPDGEGVGAGDDHRVLRSSRLDDDAHPLLRLVSLDDRLVLEVAAALRCELVLDL